jgi:hypothetical protein
MFVKYFCIRPSDDISYPGHDFAIRGGARTAMCPRGSCCGATATSREEKGTKIAKSNKLKFASALVKARAKPQSNLEFEDLTNSNHFVLCTELKSGRGERRRAVLGNHGNRRRRCSAINPCEAYLQSRSSRVANDTE